MRRVAKASACPFVETDIVVLFTFCFPTSNGAVSIMTALMARHVPQRRKRQRQQPTNLLHHNDCPNDDDADALELADTSAELTWTPSDLAGEATVWVVLRDSRGGTAEAHFSVPDL